MDRVDYRDSVERQRKRVQIVGDPEVEHWILYSDENWGYVYSVQSYMELVTHFTHPEVLDKKFYPHYSFLFSNSVGLEQNFT